MKKKTVLAIIWILLSLFLLSACGKSPEAKKVDAMIEAIGDATLENEDEIIAAEQAYAALSDAQKAEVEYADFLPIYRNNLDILKDNAAFEALHDRMIGTWVNLYDPEESEIVISEDGTAKIEDFTYEWTLNRNRETIRFEGNSRIVLAVEEHDGTLVLQNPDLMTCVKKEDYFNHYSKIFVSVANVTANLEKYFGPAVDLGAMVTEDGKDTGAHIFAFHSNAYDNGLVYFRTEPNFLLTYSVGKREHDGLYEPYGAGYITQPKLLNTLKVTGMSGTIVYIDSQYVSDLRYDSETHSRVITLTNGLELRTTSSMKPSYRGASFHVFDYLADPQYVF